MYGVSGTCSAESQFDLTIGSVQAAILAPVSQCNTYSLQPLPAFNSYYTQPGGPTGTGTVLNAGDVITNSQTVYVFAQSGACTNESSFTITINTIADPVLNTTQPTCAVATGSVQVTSPASGSGIIYPNLFISEVTDAETGSLTYVEIFNGTAAAVDLSAYKLKVYNNGNTFTSCDLTLSGILSANSTHVVAIGSATNVGGVIPNEVFASCGGVNTDDNIRLTNAADVEIDIWGATDGTNFTPSASDGYVYRRNATAIAPSLVWNTADWTALDPEEYTNVGSFNAVPPSTFTYSIDGVNYQNSNLFTNLTPGVYTITAQNTATGCISVGVSVTILVNPVISPAFAPIADLCSGETAPILSTVSPVGITGSWLPATIDNANSGSYVFTPDAGQCAITQTVGVTITPRTQPSFAAIPDVCSGTVAPSLATTSPIGITGSWLPTTIDNANSGSYVFTPNAGQCATTQTLNVNVTAPSINPSFVAIPDVCSGTVAPILATTSPIGIIGSWLPATIDNANSGTYEFTPNTGQCATTQTLNVVITPRTQPNFAGIADFCSGATAPSLGAVSPTGVSGTWLPAVISNTTSGNYIFTPNLGLCANTQTLAVNVIPNVTPDFAALAPICTGSTPPTLDSNSPNGVSGTWLPATISNTADGSYLFTPNVGQCAVPQTLSVVVTPPINLIVDGGCDNGIYVLTVSSDTPGFDETTATYQWLDSSNNVVGNDASVVLTAPGIYTCNVISAGCLSTTSTEDITSITCTIQKGISPRGTGAGDGKNDFLKLACKKLEIFNRYGMVVYSKNNYSNEWYGQSDSGSELPDGTYFYVVEQNNAPAQTGWIYINREQ